MNILLQVPGGSVLVLPLPFDPASEVPLPLPYSMHLSLVLYHPNSPLSLHWGLPHFAAVSKMSPLFLSLKIVGSIADLVRLSFLLFSLDHFQLRRPMNLLLWSSSSHVV